MEKLQHYVVPRHIHQVAEARAEQVRRETGRPVTWQRIVRDILERGLTTGTHGPQKKI